MLSPKVNELIDFINLKSHYQKHGPEVGANSRKEYLELANRALLDPRAKRLPAKRQSVKILNPKTQEVVVYNPDIDKILTYYVRKQVLE